jgi:hypothetical protein
MHWRVVWPLSALGIMVGTIFMMTDRAHGVLVLVPSAAVGLWSASMLSGRPIAQHPRRWGADRVLVCQVDRHAAEAWRDGNEPGLVTIVEPGESLR